jgi:3-oxoacyl-[acyl-carrier protein] reductase
MEINLRNEVVLVTGGSGGIGEAICRRLAGSGATVAVHYHTGKVRAERLVESVQGESAAFSADLSDPRNAVKLFGDVVGTFGKIDVLVNNAAVFLQCPVELGSERWLGQWERTMAVNLTSCAALCHQAINHFKERGGGRIIHIASRAAFRGETEEYLAYAASKGGMISLSRSIARSFGTHNIKSFVIAPGWVRTGMTEEFLKRHEGYVIENELSLGEITAPDDIAPLVVFIAGGMMDHATGCTIDVNAGSYMR